MKKILVALIALGMTSAMANHHGNHHHKGHGHKHSDIKHMITFSGFENDSAENRSFDISFIDSDNASSSNIALNYTYAINGSWMAGLSYSNAKTENNKSSTIGLHGYYNLDGKAIDTCYVGLHYNMTDLEGDDSESSTIGLEYGHRFNVGSWMGMHLAFSPSVNYSIVTTENGTEDVESSALAWNFVKFDVLF